ncbi:MAG: DUF72 domain-containing protein [Gemmatimonadota bacterium]|jgi:uncharacterized protein YecE (DUF72 family)
MSDPPSRGSWISQGDLFTEDGAPVGAAQPSADVVELARRLPPGVRLGTSSWSFPGWAGLVWDRPADRTVLSRHGLAAYTRHPLLRTVCVDRSWYGPLPRPTWRRWRAQVPDDFRFVVKADRRLSTPGEDGFLDPSLWRREVFEPAEDGLGGGLAAVILQFPPMDVDRLGGPRRFAEDLYRFLRALPTGVVHGVEIRNAELITADYASALTHGGGVHVHNVHPGAAPLSEQLERVPPGSGSALLVRWMLRPTLSYEVARDLWQPFDRLRAPDPEHRDAIATAIEAAGTAGVPAFVVVNNKAEGSSPLSVVALARRLVEGRG